MQILLALLLATVAVAMASKAMIAKDFKDGEVLELCKAPGEFLLHPTNRCKFIRCTYGDEPWQDDEGNYKFYPTVQDCPYGTAVSRAFYGHEGYGYGSEGQDLNESTLCADRVYRRHGYGYNTQSYGQDDCSVERPHGYARNGYARAGYAAPGYAFGGYAPQGFGYHGNQYGFAHGRAAFPHHGANGYYPH